MYTRPVARTAFYPATASCHRFAPFIAFSGGENRHHHPLLGRARQTVLFEGGKGRNFRLKKNRNFIIFLENHINQNKYSIFVKHDTVLKRGYYDYYTT